MRIGNGWVGWMVVLASLFCTWPASAESPWTPFIPFKKVAADPKDSYQLRDDHGPWLILAASFSGEGAERQARDLVLELRQKHNLTAYVHSQDYDFTEPVEGLTLNRYGERQRMKYANASRFKAVAVLVGDFSSIDDPNLDKALDRVKHARPDCLDLTKRKASTQKFVALREWYRRINGDEEKRSRGPMGNAFATRNPCLPTSYFVPEGIDDFVVDLNEGVEYSLMENAGQYTVKVATFRGNETINQRDVAELQRSQKVSDKLAVAADKAHRLTMALRQRKIEAYEFHDRHESIVAVGSFESEGTSLQDGTIEINPAILKIMETFGASREPIPNQPSMLGLQPKVVEGIALDVQPMPMRVPRAKTGGSLARSLTSLR
jgi:hypothetical protein